MAQADGAVQWPKIELKGLEGSNLEKQAAIVSMQYKQPCSSCPGLTVGVSLESTKGKGGCISGLEDLRLDVRSWVATASYYKGAG